MKKLLPFIILILAFAVQISYAQNLPSNFTYKRETGQETGVPIFTLVADTDAIAYDGANGNTFEALGALVQPERDKYGLMFLNAKKTYELQSQKAKGVTLTIDGEKFEIKTYSIVAKNIVGKLRMEFAAIVIDKNMFDKLVKANDVIIRVGKVIYNLDQDNIDAFQYFGKEIEKDIQRRSKPK